MYIILRKMNKKLIAPIISSLIIVIYGLSYHALLEAPHNWNLAIIWSLIYTSPVWIIFFFVEIVNQRRRSKVNKKNEI